jgi:GAF domain-containing protein
LIKRIPYLFKAGVIAALFYGLGIVDILVFGWETDARIFLLAFPVMVTLFFGQREGLTALALSTFTLMGLGAVVTSAESSQFTALVWSGVDWGYLLSNSGAFLMVSSVLIVSVGALISLLSAELGRVLEFSEKLSQEQGDLDRRAKALQSVNYAMQRRTMQLEAGAEVGRAIVSIFDLGQLLTRAVRLVTDSFGFYHTGIFLTDESGEWAVLKAASSEGGQQMLAEGHRLRRGEGMVGWTLENRQSRIALDVGEDAVRFANPLLALTRSEVALPLLIGRRVIGVLNVQSTEESAFDQDDVRAMECMAGQLAVAIENARRLSEESSLLEATSPFYRMARHVATARTGKELYTAIVETVLDYDPTQVFVFLLDREQRAMRLVADLHGSEINFPESELAQSELFSEHYLISLTLDLTQPLFVDDLTTPDDSLQEVHRQALEHLRTRSGARSLGIVPIQMGSGFLGLLVVSYHTLHAFTGAEQQLYLALADMAGVAMERTLLVQQSQERVTREHWMREFAEQMLGTLDLREMMATAATSLKELLQADGVAVAFERSDDPMAGGSNG